MYTRLEHFPNELLLHVFLYTDTRDLFYGFWGLNQRFNYLLQTLRRRSLIIEKDESKLSKLYGPQIYKLVIDTCLDVDFNQFPYLHSLILYDITKNNSLRIRTRYMPSLVYLSISSRNISWHRNQFLSLIFSQELSSLTTVNIGIPFPMHFPFFNKSYGIQSLTVCCMGTSTILTVLSLCPNLSKLHVHIEESHYLISPATPSLTNYPLKYFILSDPYDMLRVNNIDAYLTYIPNVEQIQLICISSIIFIDLARMITNRLSFLRQFDCHINSKLDDDMSSIDTVHQLHPCFKRIRCTVDEYGYRTYSTK
ncbi:hypothetical protein I4U23_001374 [Adineta vaga]|nr:hypothetical protein I4U23_001374 [Adineta vaga]